MPGQLCLDGTGVEGVTRDALVAATLYNALGVQDVSELGLTIASPGVVETETGIFKVDASFGCKNVSVRARDNDPYHVVSLLARFGLAGLRRCHQCRHEQLREQKMSENVGAQLELVALSCL